LNTIKYTQRAIITEDLMTSLFGLDKLLVGRGIYTTTAEPTAEASVTYTRIWGKHMLLIYRPPAPSLATPTAVYKFVWSLVANAAQYIKIMRDEEREAQIIEANSYHQYKVVSARSGQFLSGVVA